MRTTVLLAFALPTAGLQAVPAGKPTRAQIRPMLQHEHPSHATDMDRRSVILRSALASAFGCMYNPLPALAMDTPTLASFPGALPSFETEAAVYKALSARGYNDGNTLFATSTCPDEVNYKEKELVALMRNRWGEVPFALGGLAGVPFAGKAGLGAYAHHVPDEGKLLITFAPHVGVGIDGKVGAIERAGQVAISSACGAGIGALKTLTKPGYVPPSAALIRDLDDTQFEWIKLKLGPKLDGIEESENPVAFVTYMMYELVRDSMIAQVKASPGIWQDCSEVALLGGVQINRYGGDRFQPLFFQTLSASGKSTDMYKSAFGLLPDLTEVLGDAEAAQRMLKANLEGGLSL